MTTNRSENDLEREIGKKAADRAVCARQLHRSGLPASGPRSAKLRLWISASSRLRAEENPRQIRYTALPSSAGGKGMDSNERAEKAAQVAFNALSMAQAYGILVESLIGVL